MNIAFAVARKLESSPENEMINVSKTMVTRQGSRLGMGQPHSTASFAAKKHSVPPAIAAADYAQRTFLNMISLKWAIGSLDDLRKEEEKE